MAIDFIAIGASLGGLKALTTVFKALPTDFAVPIGVVIHRHTEMDSFLVDILQEKCKLPVYEANDKSPIQSGTITIAPANYHLLVDKGVFSLIVDDPVASARPSIDVFFESCADIFGQNLMAVLLTGSGEDGTLGMSVVQHHGGQLLVEEPSTAECSEMPQAAIVKTGTKNVWPLSDIGPQLVKQCLTSVALEGN